MIFLDASFLVSFFSEDEIYHRAIELLKEFENNQNKKMIISYGVINEVINVLNNKLKVDREVINYAYEFMNNELIIINDIPYFNNTMDIINRFYPKRMPFFDCLYIAIMKDLGINEIATFDKHFNNIDQIMCIN